MWQFPEDYDADGRTDFAVYRPSLGLWFIFRSSDSTTQFVSWGIDGDTPVTGDFTGDRRADVGMFRPSTGHWYILNSNGSGQYESIQSQRGRSTCQQ